MEGEEEEVKVEERRAGGGKREGKREGKKKSVNER